MPARSFRSALICAPLLAASPAQAEPARPAPTLSLEEQFRDPPVNARPRVWWHWMNGNITVDGITKDLEWMKRVGIGGAQTFDADLFTPKVVDQRLAFMTPEWQGAFRHAATTADRLGLELAIAGSPGWSETGGPWVTPEDGMKKLVWSETQVAGGKRFNAKLAAPPANSGPFQTLAPSGGIGSMTGRGGTASLPAYVTDVAVLAYPVANALAAPRVSAATGPVDGAALFDDSLKTALIVPLATPEHPGVVTLDFGAPRTIGAARLQATNGSSATLEASDDGTIWRPVATLPLSSIPVTKAFAPVTARLFRLDVKISAPFSFPGTGSAPTAPPAKTVAINQFLLSAEPLIDRAEAKAAFSLTPEYYALTTTAGANDQGVAPGKVIDLTGQMQSDGTLDWTPPKGTWRVLRLGYSPVGAKNHPASAEATGLEVDKYDAAAVQRYLETYLGMYRDAAGADLVGKRGLRALLTDSTEVSPANWTGRMVEQFKRLRGYDPIPWLPALTGVVIGSRTDSDAFLYDFRRTLADLMASEHYGTVAKVAHEHGLIVYGEALEDRRPVIGDDIAMRRYADVPMAAMWIYDRKAGPKPTYIADIKGAASVAHLYGQNLVAAESLTSTAPPWSAAPADLRSTIDLEFVTGVNRPVIHTSVHQPLDKGPGLSLYIVGQFFNRLDSWAEMAKPWVDYMARTGLMLQQGRNVADVAYFYGEEAPLTGLFGIKPIPDAPRRNAYDFVNADVLSDVLSVDNGALAAKSGARYRVLYLGGTSSRMTLPTLKRLAVLVEAGAVVVGDAPIGSPGLGDNAVEYQTLVKRLWSGGPMTAVGKGKVFTGKDIEAALAAGGVGPDFSYAKPLPDSEVLFAHRQLPDGDAYFLTNRQDRSERIEARFRVSGKAPEIWHADTGISEPVSYRIEGNETVVPLDFEADGSFFVVFRKPATTPAATIARAAFVPIATLSGPWDVSFQTGRGAPPSTKLPALASLSEQAQPGIKYFSGIATYTKRFTLPRDAVPGAPLKLDLGTFGDVAEVRVNGELIGTVWHAPHKIDIGRAVKRGANQLDIRVANTWVNRLIGDAQPGASKITFTTIPTYAAGSPLRASGLIGPVVLETQSR